MQRGADAPACRRYRREKSWSRTWPYARSVLSGERTICNNAGCRSREVEKWQRNRPTMVKTRVRARRDRVPRDEVPSRGQTSARDHLGVARRRAIGAAGGERHPVVLYPSGGADQRSPPLGGREGLGKRQHGRRHARHRGQRRRTRLRSGHRRRGGPDKHARAQTIGGESQIDSKPERGSRVSLRVPLPPLDYGRGGASR
jgi:hypothetical protein